MLVFRLLVVPKPLVFQSHKALVALAPVETAPTPALEYTSACGTSRNRLLLRETVPRVVLQYTATLWACKARKWVMVVKGLAELLRPVSSDSHLVADSLKGRVSEVREFKGEAK